MKSLTSNYPLLVLGLILLSFATLFSYLTVAQHLGLKTQMNDLGNMVQPIYNTAQGRFMHMSNMETTGALPNRLGGHTNYIFLFFVPLFALLPYPSLLLVFQVLLIASAAIPLYLLGKKLFPKNIWLPLIGPIVYLTNPQIQDITLFDFHALSLAMPLIIWAFYFLTTGQLKWYAVFCVLAILCKEDMSLVILMLGIYQAVFLKQVKPGLITALLAGVFFIVNLFVVMPYFRGGASWTLITDRYGEFGGSVGSVAVSPFTKTQQLLSTLLETSKLSYLFMLLLSVGGLALLAPHVLLPTLPHIGINLLSNNQIMHQPFQFYHMAIIMAFLIIGSLYGLKKLLTNHPEKSTLIALGFLSWVFLYSWLYSPVPCSRVSSFKDFEVTAHHRKIEEIKALIPPEASVSAQNNVGAHLSKRTSIYTFPEFADQTEYVVVDIHDPYSTIRATPRQRNFVYIASMELETYQQSIEQLLQQPDLGVVEYSQDGWLVFKRGADRSKNQSAASMAHTQLNQLTERYQEYISATYSD